MIDSKQITVGFKVPALKKKEIDRTAAELGVDVSTYLRDGILGDHEKIKRLSNVPDELVFAPEDIEAALETIQYLQSRHPKASSSQILLGALKLAAQNETRIASSKLIKHL